MKINLTVRSDKRHDKIHTIVFKKDVDILSYSFNEFVKVSMNHLGLNPIHYVGLLDHINGR